METIKLLEYLQEIANTAPKVPISGKIMINKKELIEILDEVINTLPEDFRKAQWVLQEKERILDEAIKRADNIENENIKRIKDEIDNHDVLREARERAEEIIAQAQRDAKAIRLSARDYADDLLSELNHELIDRKNKMLSVLTDKMEEFMQSVDTTINTNDEVLRQNIKELRNNQGNKQL